MSAGTHADTRLEPLDALVGQWRSVATHPSVPGLEVTGTADAAWLAGGWFLEIRSATDHPDFPDATWLIGLASEDVPDASDELMVQYFDSRGVHRIYGSSMRGGRWSIHRDSQAGFRQRFVGTFGEGGDTLTGLWMLCTDGATWNDDLAFTWRRA